ncbi:MAG: DUF3034 family protein [Rhizobacter sp.]|nr:DUF3034 family protein [Bacteriovorax sp.]
MIKFSLLFIFLTLSNAFAIDTSGKLLLTGGVSQIEGAAGGGLTPWAFIGGYGTKDQIAANAFYTNVNITDYRLETFGALIGILDRAEISVAKQTFDTEDVGRLLGLGSGFKIRQNIFGLKVKIIGDGVLDQDSWLPQISFGAQYKKNLMGEVVKSLKATEDHGLDTYLTATKIILSQSILVNATLRRTKANQLGILGFGGDGNDKYKYEMEGSLAYLICRNLAVGFEFRSKPDNLKVAREQNWSDAFLAWAPTKNISITTAYTTLGNIALKDDQKGFYNSIQIGF